MKKKLEKQLLDLYKKVYNKIYINFDEIKEKDRNDWFNHYYVPHDAQEAVLKEGLKYKSEYVKQILSFNYWLGCSPSSVDFYYELTKKDEPSFFKSSSRVKWMDFEEGLDSWYTLPETGRSLLMSPFDLYFTWLTTPVLEYEIVDWNVTEFKTKNSNYILTRKLKK